MWLTISIEVVKDSHTSFLLPSLLSLLSVIRLRSASSVSNHPPFIFPFHLSILPSSVWPVMELVTIGWRHFYLVGWPEPSIDQLREELRLVAPAKVTFSARGPEVWNTAWKILIVFVFLSFIPLTIYEPLNPIIFLLSFKGHQVHAPLPAVVPGVEPVPLGVPHLSAWVLPAHVVVTPTKPVDSGHTCSCEQ